MNEYQTERERVDLTGVEWTMLVTLYLRAQESRSPGSILRDDAAADAMRRIGYNFNTLKMRATAGDRYLVVLRAKQLDEWAADFLRRHPDATVVQLGCGLDSRAFRLAIPEGVRWFDVDFPDVIELRRKLYPENDRYRTIASSVTDSGWLEEIPVDRPVLVIAEGLLMYLTEDDVRTLLGRITDRFPTGELVFDGMDHWVIKVSRTFVRGPYASFAMHWPAREGRDVERLNPELRCREVVSAIGQVAKIPVTGHRVLYRLLRRVPKLGDALRLFRCEF
jgi:methyltransferase (TIGR00027 family)